MLAFIYILDVFKINKMFEAMDTVPNIDFRGP